MGCPGHSSEYLKYSSVPFSAAQVRWTDNFTASGEESSGDWLTSASLGHAAWNWGAFFELYNARSLERVCLFWQLSFTFWHCFCAESNVRKSVITSEGYGAQMLTGPEQLCFCSQWIHNLKAVIQVFVSAWHRSLADSMFSCHLQMASWCKHKGITHSVSVVVWKLFLLLPLVSLPTSVPALSLAFWGMMPGKVEVPLRVSGRALSHEPTWQCCGATCRTAVLNS